ncbi:ATP-binding protein [Candidatus Phytoplasma oryzae]|nr:SbcC/MukB-like Walker B domain-containing protein [Candidatus Phytoplasma oryzae]
MKKLTKIQLINWHLFSLQTIDIKDNTLISGENGVGKSTLLDALQYILIGGKFGTKFNIAANENAKRSLENYIKGKIGAENREFLRNKDVITHIVLEFYSEKSSKYTLIGCVLELPYKGILKEKFYILNDFKLEKDTLISDNKPKNIQQVRNFFKNKFEKFDFFDTKKSYQKNLEDYLKINVQKYIKILPKALAFKPLNLQNFVFDFLLEENPINIMSLKNSVQQLKKIEKQIEIEKEKIDKLTKIIEFHEKIKLLKNQKKIIFFVQKIILSKKIKDILQKLENEKEYLKIEIKNFFFQKEQTNLYLEQINEKILELKISLRKDSSNVLYYNDAENFKKKKKIVEILEEKIFKYQNKIKEELKILEKLSHLTKDKIIIDYIEKINIFLKSHIKDNKYLILQKNFSDISEQLYKIKISVNIEKNDINNKMIKLKKEILEKNFGIEKLNGIFFNYNPNITKLINKIQENLFLKYNKIINIHPLCELIEVKEELWRNSIEGILGKRKFNLIIDSNFFDQALNIYEKFQSIEKIYDVGLVNIDKIPFISYNDESLASKIKSDNKQAIKYVNLLLSHIICELKTSNLKKHKTAITPQGMLYSNFTAQQLNPKTYKIPFIGMYAKKIQKQIFLEEINKLEYELINQQNYFKKKEELIFLLNKINLSSFSISDYILWKKQLSESLTEIDKIENEIKKIKLNPYFVDIEKQIKNIQEDKKQLKEKIDNILLNIAENKNKIVNIKKKIFLNNEELLKIEKELQDEEKKEIIDIESAKIQLQNYLFKYKKNYDSILINIKESLIAIEKQNSKYKIDIISQMSSYIEKNNLINVDAKIENIDYFIKEYNLIYLKNLINYEQEAKELSFKIEIIFKEEFINKLKESLEKTLYQIQKLNEILKNRPFGNDYYKIITKPSENPEYQKYFSIFMENDDRKETDLFENNMDDYKKILLDELFHKIMSFNKETELLTYEFLDYRNYLSYDIQIKDQNGNLSLFSKVFREKSGGETQVPFYIIIAICFEQLLFENSYEKGCLVLFDEAFNNMDENRIDAMMSFFNELKIQFILAVPPQRIINILPHVTTNLVIIKENNYALIENFTIEK